MGRVHRLVATSHAVSAWELYMELDRGEWPQSLKQEQDLGSRM